MDILDKIKGDNAKMYKKNLTHVLAQVSRGKRGDKLLGDFVRMSLVQAGERATRCNSTPTKEEEAGDLLIKATYQNLEESHYPEGNYERTHLRTALLATFFAAIMAETYTDRHVLEPLIRAAMAWHIQNGN